MRCWPVKKQQQVSQRIFVLFAFIRRPKLKQNWSNQYRTFKKSICVIVSFYKCRFSLFISRTFFISLTLVTAQRLVMHYCSSFLRFEDEVKTISETWCSRFISIFVKRFSNRVWICFRKRTRRHYLTKPENSSLVHSWCEFLFLAIKLRKYFSLVGFLKWYEKVNKI